METLGIEEVHIIKVVDGHSDEIEDRIPVESPLQISINQMPFVVTMRTPGQDRELARGLLFTEGVITEKTLDFQTVETKCRRDIPLPVTRIIDVQVPPELVHFQEKNLRSLLAASSCGFCGKTHIADIGMQSEKLPVPQSLKKSTIFPMLSRMQQAQAEFNATGGTHAAAAFTIEGMLLSVYEDIGRHNAVDKVIGDLLEKKLLDHAQCLTVSGRVSYEILTKAYAAKIPYILAVSTVSSLVIEMAEERGLTIIGFCRKNRYNVYTNPQQLID